MQMPSQVSEGALGLIDERKLLINGGWIEGQGPSNPVIDPFQGKTLCDIRFATTGQVSEAIKSARNSFDSGVWSNSSPQARSEVLHRLADLMLENRNQMVELFVAEAGCPISLARSLNVDLPIEHMRWLADKAAVGPNEGWQQELPVHQWSKTGGYVVREPIGVVAALSPYNVPYIAYVWKIGTALATGCSCVLMPSPRTPLTAVAFSNMVKEAGVPDGVFNLVFGGPDQGKILTESPEVDLVTFTGSNAVGEQVATQASKTAKRVLVELGGKSPNIVLPGVDVEEVVAPSLTRLYRNAGQGCAVTSRTFVPRESYERYVELAKNVISNMVVGDPWKEDTWVGPLIREDHRDRVEGFVKRAIEQGGRIEAGGGRPENNGPGFFMNPVLVGGLPNTAEIAQNEQFGPVGVIFPYDSIDEMVDLANQTRYGLNANIWGPREEAVAVAKRIKSGNVTINGGGPLRPDVPFCGYKQSGNGREMGDEGFNEFLELKHISWLES